LQSTQSARSKGGSSGSAAAADGLALRRPVVLGLSSSQIALAAGLAVGLLLIAAASFSLRAFERRRDRADAGHMNVPGRSG
jgi:hypothetical protein